MHAAGDLRISKGFALNALVGKFLPLLFQTLLHVVVQLNEKHQETTRNDQPHKGVESLISRLRTHLASSGSAWDPDACISSTLLLVGNQWEPYVGVRGCQRVFFPPAP